MLQLNCDRCGRELTQPGALVFSPPKADGWQVEKYHVCVGCWEKLVEELRAGKHEAGRPRE